MTVHILGIAGSLRKLSLNRGLLRAAQELAPEDVTVEIFDLLSIPLYNGDVEAEGDPDSVRELKDRIRASDALLLVTPEYNHLVPGVLKNAVDWASRPEPGTRQRALWRKPVGLMGASSGMVGTARSQAGFRQVFASTESYVMPKPDVLVGFADKKFDAEANLTDEQTRQKVHAFMAALADWARRVRPE